MTEKKEKTVLNPSVGADGGQPILCNENSISEAATENKPSYEEVLRKLNRVTDPAYLPTISMSELYENVYQGRPPIIDGLLYPGTYLFAGSPKVGKSFFMAQLAYHVSTGTPLWDFPVHQGSVLYLALEDDHRRLQKRLYRMFGAEGTDNLHFAVFANLQIGVKPQNEKSQHNFYGMKMGITNQAGQRGIFANRLNMEQSFQLSGCACLGISAIRCAFTLA